MKNTIWMIIVVMLFVLMACGKSPKKSQDNQVKSYRETLRLKGDVKNMRSTVYKARENFGEIEKTEFVNDEIVTFDDRGFADEHYSFDSDGKLTYKAWKEGGPFVDTGVFLSSQGAITKRLKFEKDDRGNTIVTWVYAPDGAVLGKTMYRVDYDNNVTEVAYYGNDGTPTQKTAYSYNSEGKIIEKRVVNAQGQQVSRTEYLYDILLKTINPTGEASSRIEYDQHDSPTLEVRYIAYTSDGDLISSVANNFSNETTFIFEYEYDQNKNWTRKISKKNGVVYELEERQFNISLPAEALVSFEENTAARSTIRAQVQVSSSREGYPGSNVLDGNPSTAWVAQYPGEGNGESLEFRFDQPTDIDNIVIVPGYNRDEATWLANNRLKGISLQYSNNTDIQQFTLEDIRKSHAIPVNRKALSWVRLSISSTYAGSRWQDTCVSDISFF